jgi:hypothetical protein
MQEEHDDYAEQWLDWAEPSFSIPVIAWFATPAARR